MSEMSGTNGGRDGNGSLPDSLSRALAVYQAPSQFSELLHGKAELPDEIGLLLRLAGGAALPEGMALPPFSAPEDVREAALFFIEQVLLAHDANHYRVLGVRPTAGLDELKENHRLLMRLFHPDRRVLAMENERKAAHAARINLAYTTLRQPATRTAYDLSLRQARQAAIQMPQMRPTLRRHAPEPAPILSPRVARHLPQLVLGGFALLAMAAVGVVYLNQAPTGAIGMGENFAQAQALPAASASAPVTAQHDNPQIERLKELAAAWSDDETSVEVPGGLPLPTMAAATITTATATSDADKPAPSAVPAVPAMAAAAATPPPVKAMTVSAPPTPSTSPASTKPALVAASRPTALASASASAAKPQTASNPPPRLPATATSPPAEPLRPEKATAAPVAATAPIAAPPTATRAETPPTPAPVIVAKATPTPPPAPETPPTVDNHQENLETLLGAFTLLYEKGDLEAFLALFDENARSENGGKTRIRNDYDSLFRTTAARKLYIYDMNWVQDGDIYRGKGGFQAKVRPKGAASQRVYDGTITLEVLNRPAPASLLIRRISHKTG